MKQKIIKEGIELSIIKKGMTVKMIKSVLKKSGVYFMAITILIILGDSLSQSVAAAQNETIKKEMVQNHKVKKQMKKSISVNKTIQWFDFYSTASNKPFVHLEYAGRDKLCYRETFIGSYVCTGWPGQDYCEVTVKDKSGTLSGHRVYKCGGSKTGGTVPDNHYWEIPVSEGSSVSITHRVDGWRLGTSNNEDLKRHVSKNPLPTYTYVVKGNRLVTKEDAEHPYTVTFRDSDGRVLDTQKVVHGLGAKAPENPTREGYVFAGWDRTFDRITGDTVITARYEQERDSKNS